MAPTLEAIAELGGYRHDSDAYAAFVTALAQNCVHLLAPESYEMVVKRAASELR